jgi:hypothetical protein
MPLGKMPVCRMSLGRMILGRMTLMVPAFDIRMTLSIKTP